MSELWVHLLVLSRASKKPQKSSHWKAAPRLHYLNIFCVYSCTDIEFAFELSWITSPALRRGEPVVGWFAHFIGTKLFAGTSHRRPPHFGRTKLILLLACRANLPDISDGIELELSIQAQLERSVYAVLFERNEQFLLRCFSSPQMLVVGTCFACFLAVVGLFSISMLMLTRRCCHLLSLPQLLLLVICYCCSLARSSFTSSLFLSAIWRFCNGIFVYFLSLNVCYCKPNRLFGALLEK